MASWQDIRVLEERIYDAVQEYLENTEAYTKPVLHVFLDQDEMQYKAEADDGLNANGDNGIYSMTELIRADDNNNPEPDIDKISSVANSWIFLN